MDCKICVLFVFPVIYYIYILQTYFYYEYIPSVRGVQINRDHYVIDFNTSIMQPNYVLTDVISGTCFDDYQQTYTNYQLYDFYSIGYKPVSLIPYSCDLETFIPISVFASNMPDYSYYATNFALAKLQQILKTCAYDDYYIYSQTGKKLYIPAVCYTIYLTKENYLLGYETYIVNPKSKLINRHYTLPDWMEFRRHNTYI